MVENDTLQKIINKTLANINNSQSYLNFYHFETLYNLGSKIEWSQSDIDKIDNLSKNIDINKNFLKRILLLIIIEILKIIIISN